MSQMDDKWGTPNQYYERSYYYYYCHAFCYRSGRVVWGMKCLRPLEHWDCGFVSHSRHGCLSAFILFVLSCVGSGLATGWSPGQGILPTVYKIKKLKEVT
jgi:hypothetical protein